MNDLFDNDHPTIDAQTTTRGHTVECPHCDGFTRIPPYRESPQKCDKCDGEFNVPGRLG